MSEDGQARLVQTRKSAFSPLQALLPVDPVDGVVNVAGQAMHAGLGAAWVPPTENCPKGHAAHVAPPVPAGQMVTAGERSAGVRYMSAAMSGAANGNAVTLWPSLAAPPLLGPPVQLPTKAMPV